MRAAHWQHHLNVSHNRVPPTSPQHCTPRAHQCVWLGCIRESRQLSPSLRCQTPPATRYNLCRGKRRCPEAWSGKSTEFWVIPTTLPPLCWLHTAKAAAPMLPTPTAGHEGTAEEEGRKHGPSWGSCLLQPQAFLWSISQ